MSRYSSTLINDDLPAEFPGVVIAHLFTRAGRTPRAFKEYK